jgi:hypothetical protein
VVSSPHFFSLVWKFFLLFISKRIRFRL